MLQWIRRREWLGKLVRGNVPDDSSTPYIPRIAGDNPIRSAEGDLIGRDTSARSFARHIQKLDAREGLVVGVLGSWGSGKTSFVNLTRVHLAESEITVLDFNPWMFSGAEQLITSFFNELASQIKVKRQLADLGDRIQSYGDALTGLEWIPVAGNWIKATGGLAKLASGRLKKNDRGISGRRTAVEDALRALDRPIAVVLDDIDRLTTSEIRDIFKLVRLTASFPNLIYIVVFDRARVERALDEDGLKGRAYLEKILQHVVDLPVVPEGVIQRQVLVAIDESLKGIENQGPFDESRWPDVFMEIIHPLISNMRDMRRYATAVHGTVCELEGSISVVDVLALEAIRIFLPDTFGMFRRAIGGLTSIQSGFGNNSPHFKSQIDVLIQSADEHQEVVKSLVRRVFPAGERHLGGTHFSGSYQGRWLRDRRVAHEDLLRLYLERVAGERLNAFLDAEKAYALFDDEMALEHYLRSLSPERVEDVVSQLESYEDSFTEGQIIPAVAVLLNLLPDIPEKQRGFLELDARLVVGRVVYRLLKKLEDQAVAETAVRVILPKLRSLSAKLELISDVGYRDGRGHKLISENAAKDLECEWRAEVRQATAQELATEHEILWVLLLTQREAEVNEPVLVVPDSPELTLAILRKARGETKSQSDGSRAIRRSYRLPWNALIELYGSEEALKLRIEGARALVPPTDDFILLANKYLGGWRPSDHSED